MFDVFNRYVSIFWTKGLFIRLVKWGFTWLLALLPIIFHILNDFLETGNFDMPKICATGEVFLVCIVMVAEPLGDIIMARKRTGGLLVVTFCSILFIASSTYVFSNVNSTQRDNKHGNSLVKFHENTSNVDTTYVHLSCVHCMEIRNETNITKERKSRLGFLSEIYFIFSFTLGFVSVCIANIDEK